MQRQNATLLIGSGWTPTRKWAKIHNNTESVRFDWRIREISAAASMSTPQAHTGYSLHQQAEILKYSNVGPNIEVSNDYVGWHLY